MARGGSRPGAGRKAGTPNKVTAARQAAVEASGLTPLDYMLQVLRDDTKPMDARLDAAKAAAPYVHPKPAQQVIHAGDEEGGPIAANVTHNGQVAISASAAFIAEALGAGAAAASEEPGEG